jgi:hypothetical protein
MRVAGEVYRRSDEHLVEISVAWSDRESRSEAALHFDREG